MIYLIKPFLQIFYSTVGFAAEEHAGPAQILPGDVHRLIYHSIDLAILFGGLYLLLRVQLKSFFATRGQKFDQAVKVARKARDEAEHHNIEIKAKLRKLEESAAHSVNKAQQDALELQKNMIQEARELADHMIKESENTAQYESARAFLHLQEEVADMSLRQAREQMKSAVNDTEQLRLEREFIEKIQVR